jgi:hypothetical protein
LICFGYYSIGGFLGWEVLGTPELDTRRMLEPTVWSAGNQIDCRRRREVGACEAGRRKEFIGVELGCTNLHASWWYVGTSTSSTQSSFSCRFRRSFQRHFGGPLIIEAEAGYAGGRYRAHLYGRVPGTFVRIRIQPPPDPVAGRLLYGFCIEPQKSVFFAPQAPLVYSSLCQRVLQQYRPQINQLHEL